MERWNSRGKGRYVSSRLRKAVWWEERWAIQRAGRVGSRLREAGQWEKRRTFRREGLVCQLTVRKVSGRKVGFHEEKGSYVSSRVRKAV